MSILIGYNSYNYRFSNYFHVVEEGTVAAVAAATHPRFKLKWLQCLDPQARTNVMTAIQVAIAACHIPSEEKIVQKVIEDDEFNFGPQESSSAVAQQNLDVGAGEAEYRRFCQDPKSDLELLLAYPTVKNVFLKTNTLLPSSASVERMFSFATMFDIAKFNRLTDENFEKRVLCRANVIIADPNRTKIRKRKLKN